MNDNQRNYIAWCIIIFLVSGYSFFKIDKQDNTEVLLDRIQVLIDNQTKLERKISELKRNLPTEIKDIECKSLTKALLLVVQVNNKLLKDAKFSDFHNYINEIKLLSLIFNNHEMEGVLHILENIKEIDTLNEIKSLFEQAVDKVNQNKYSLFKKIISNWVKIRHKHDPMRVKWIEIKEFIDTENWQNVNNVIKDFTDPEFKLLVDKLRNLIIVLENVSIVYNHLLQYIS